MVLYWHPSLNIYFFPTYSYTNIFPKFNYMELRLFLLFIFRDFAAHNCFVSIDNIVKIGDYGISFDRWKVSFFFFF